jgi:hypothetical protein
VKELGLTADEPENEVAGLGNDRSEIIFVGYGGKGPAIEEVSWWGTYVMDGLLLVHYNGPDGTEETFTLPAPALPAAEFEKAQKGEKTKSGTTLHIKFAMPSLKTYPSQTSYFTVSHKALHAPITSMVVNDYDKLAAKYLDDGKTSTLLRTVIRVVLRSIAAQKTKSELSGSNPLLNLMVNVGTDVLADQLEKADTRTCFLIPKTVQMARIEVAPGVHSIDVAARTSSGAVLNTKTFSNINVAQGGKTLIFYSSFQ